MLVLRYLVWTICVPTLVLVQFKLLGQERCNGSTNQRRRRVRTLLVALLVVDCMFQAMTLPSQPQAAVTTSGGSGIAHSWGHSRQGTFPFIAVCSAVVQSGWWAFTTPFAAYFDLYQQLDQAHGQVNNTSHTKSHTKTRQRHINPYGPKCKLKWGKTVCPHMAYTVMCCHRDKPCCKR